MLVRRTFTALALVLAAAGCRTARPAPRLAIGASASAQEVLDALEQRLLGAPWALDFEVSSRGFVESRFAGRVEFEPGARIELDARGEFMARPKVLRLAASRDFLQASASADGVVGARETASARPAALDEALVVGFTHMGLLHNLALLSEGQPPDHCAGGVREWLGRVELRLWMPEPLEGRQARKLSFGIQVGGRRSAEVELWLAVDDGLPLRRTVNVNFPDGVMHVVEHYTWNADAR